MIAPTIFEQIVTIIATFIIIIGVLQNVVFITQLVLAFGFLTRHRPAKRIGTLWERNAAVAPPISLLVPAHNEEINIAESVRSLLALQYPNIEVIVVNDGSRDGTMAALIEAFGLIPNVRAEAPMLSHQHVRGVFISPQDDRLIVVDKENGGKADALNCAINFSRAPIFCAIDADSILEKDSLLRAVEPFIEDPERTIAVGATVRVANGCLVEKGSLVRIGLPRSPLAMFQTVEYLRAFLMARLAWSEMGALTIVSGAFGLFQKDAVIDVGGYTVGTVAEDLELVIKLHRLMRDRQLPYRINFIPEPVCWTEVPESIRSLGMQRARWQRGALETFFAHSDMILRPRYGRIGSLGFLHMMLIDVISPLTEILGYLFIPLLWAMGWLSFEFFLAFIALTFAFGIAISVGALVLEELELRRFPKITDLTRLLIAAIAENFGYRQLNNFWRIRGMWQFLRREKGWGQLTRQGFRQA